MEAANVCSKRETVDKLHQRLEREILAFVTAAVEEGWPAERIDGDLRRWGFGLEERAPAGHACH